MRRHKTEYLKAFAKLDLNFSGEGDIICKGFEWVNSGVEREQARNLGSIDQPPSSLAKLTLPFYPRHQRL